MEFVEKKSNLQWILPVQSSILSLSIVIITIFFYFFARIKNFLFDYVVGVNLIYVSIATILDDSKWSFFFDTIWVVSAKLFLFDLKLNVDENVHLKSNNPVGNVVCRRKTADSAIVIRTHGREPWHSITFWCTHEEADEIKSLYATQKHIALRYEEAKATEGKNKQAIIDISP